MHTKHPPRKQRYVSASGLHSTSPIQLRVQARLEDRKLPVSAYLRKNIRNGFPVDYQGANKRHVSDYRAQRTIRPTLPAAQGLEFGLVKTLNNSGNRAVSNNTVDD
jgi:hypothetical protein